MHEASLVMGILNLVEKTVRDHNAAHPENQISRVEGINCEMGLIACVEPQTLTSCFELFAEGTIAEGAELIIESQPLPCHCENCGNEFALSERKFVCPACGNANIQFSGGHGLLLKSLRVDSKEDEHARTHSGGIQ